MNSDDKILATAFAVAAAVGVLGVSTCVGRNRSFEDECRRAGGFLVTADKIAPQGTLATTCAVIGPDDKVRPLALPNYRKVTP
jgi:hypothetical protein